MINFPSSPTNGQSYTDPTSGVIYKYHSPPGVWKVNSVIGAASSSETFLVATNIAPNMTGETSGGATATASTSYYLTPAWYAFQNKRNKLSTQVGWINNGGSTGWLRIQFDTAKSIIGYGVVPYSYDVWNGRALKSWTFEGSNNGTDWTTLDTQTNFLSFARYQEIYFPLAEEATYTYFRINVTANNGDGYTGVTELALYKIGDPVNNGFNLIGTLDGSNIFVPLSSNFASFT